jgi:hypothetical protein
LIPRYQIRADYDDRTIVVYQAYRPEIADAAVRAGRFVAPFSRERMTWVKPSFAWMMHRCGWATKEGQERVLALRLTRDGFDAALRDACLSSFRPDVYASHDAWKQRMRATSVRVQWDPERTLQDVRLEHRSIQIGLGAKVVPTFVDAWIVELHDITAHVRTMRARLDAGDLEGAEAMRAQERPYPVSPEIESNLGMTR